MSIEPKRETVTVGRWLVVGVGCLECGEASDVSGPFETREEAEAANTSPRGGQYATFVVDLLNIQEWYVNDPF